MADEEEKEEKIEIQKFEYLEELFRWKKSIFRNY